MSVVQPGWEVISPARFFICAIYFCLVINNNCCIVLLFTAKCDGFFMIYVWFHACVGGYFVCLFDIPAHTKHSHLFIFCLFQTDHCDFFQTYKIISLPVHQNIFPSKDFFYQTKCTTFIKQEYLNPLCRTNWWYKLVKWAFIYIKILCIITYSASILKPKNVNEISAWLMFRIIFMLYDN